MPNLLPQTQMAPPTMLSEHEGLLQQREEALKCQELEARELDFERRTQDLQLQILQSLRFRQGLELNAVTEEMLRLDPLLPLRGAAELGFSRNTAP